MLQFSSGPKKIHNLFQSLRNIGEQTFHLSHVQAPASSSSNSRSCYLGTFQYSTTCKRAMEQARQQISLLGLGICRLIAQKNQSVS